MRPIDVSMRVCSAGFCLSLRAQSYAGFVNLWLVGIVVVLVSCNDLIARG